MEQKNGNPSNPARRGFFKRWVEFFMAAGLVMSYGTFLSILSRYLYPSKDSAKAMLFVGELSRFKAWDSLAYQAPNGEKIAIARRAMNGTAADFVALSSTCPHLGCQVHWEAAQSRFFCPCHNGAFNSDGKAIAGPPAEAKQSLFTYPLRVENEILYIEAPLERLNKASEDSGYPDMPAPGLKTPPLQPGGR